MDTTETLLQAILATFGRQTFPPEELARIVKSHAGGEKQIIAFNLCDGNTTQKEICKKTKLDSGNLSRSISRWVEAGIVFRLGPEKLPLHIYPLPKEFLKTPKRKGK